MIFILIFYIFLFFGSHCDSFIIPEVQAQSSPTWRAHGTQVHVRDRGTRARWLDTDQLLMSTISTCCTSTSTCIVWKISQTEWRRLTYWKGRKVHIVHKVSTCPQTVDKSVAVPTFLWIPQNLGDSHRFFRDLWTEPQNKRPDSVHKLWIHRFFFW